MTSVEIEHRIDALAADWDALAAEWDALADRAPAGPFLRPGWIAAWWRTFGAGSLEIIALRRDGRLAAILPLGRQRGRLYSPTNAHTPQFGVLAEDPAAARAVIAELFARRAGRVRLASLEAGDPSFAAALAAARGAGYRVLVRPLLRSPYLDLDLDGDLEAYRGRRRRGFQADLRRRRRRLAEQGRIRFDVEDGTTRLDALLDEAFAVEATGWKGARGTAIAARAATRRFYTDVARWAAARGALRLLFLRLDGAPLAFLLTVEEARAQYLVKGGFDPAYARFSPGQLLLDETVARAFAVGHERLEFLGGDEPYKLEWTTTVRERALLLAVAPSVVGALDWAALAYGRPLAERSGLDAALRPLRDRALARFRRG